MVELKEIKKQIDNVRNKYNDYSDLVKHFCNTSV